MLRFLLVLSFLVLMGSPTEAATLKDGRYKPPKIIVIYYGYPYKTVIKATVTPRKRGTFFHYHSPRK
jgi:hypothetical protein